MLSNEAAARLRTALEWVTEQADGNPDADQGGVWDQGSWDRCIGHRLAVIFNEETGQGDPESRPWAGAELALGATEAQADRDEINEELDALNVWRLFNASNTVARLWSIAERITDGAIVNPFKPGVDNTAL